MCDWIDKLSDFTKNFFKRTKEVSLFKDINFEKYSQVVFLRSPEENKLQLVDNGGYIRVNLEKLTAHEYDEIKKYVVNSLENDSTTILEIKSNETREDFQETEEADNSVEEILAFFKDKVSSKDLDTIRMSLYVRNLYRRENKGLADRYRSEIRNDFGERGSNICKLCTAGYLEIYLIPLAKLVSDTNEKFTIEDFKIMYEIIVEETAFSVFISNSMTENEVLSAITDQLESNKRYSVRELAIHGIGKHNIKKINNALSEIESKNEPLDKEIIQKKNVMTVKYQF